MKLKEYEAKKLLQEAGIAVSEGLLISDIEQIPDFQEQRIIKVQTLAGGRGKAGGIITVNDSKEAKEVSCKFLGKTFLDEEINELLLDEKITIEKELYLGIIFDTSKKCPLLIFSWQGGVDIERLKENNPEEIIIKEIDYLQGIDLDVLRDFPLFLYDCIQKLYACFVRFDCKVIEINPLVLINNNLVAVDAVAVLDDDAHFRREISFPERTSNRHATPREIAAREIDKNDYRGVAGKTFLELDGDIAILTSGGGASMALMDALLESGGAAANFTEYSGNPSSEKVEKLTRIVLEKENLSGLLVAGVIANFTNIAETLQGVVNVLKALKPPFPIVIRRAGPDDDKAKAILQKAKEEYGLDIHFFDENVPLTKAAEIMVELSNKYKATNIKQL